MQRVGHHARRGVTTILDSLLPPDCPCCGGESSGVGLVCASCFDALRMIGAPACRRCGVPVSSSAMLGREGGCPRCHIVPPVWRHGAAAFVYDDWSRRIILPLKYADRTENALMLARHMMRAGADMLQTADVLVPVPLHRARLRTRRYNQSALLASRISRLCGVALGVDVLERWRATRRLADFSAKQRREEVTGAIRVRRGRTEKVRGRRVVLVDDVLTTGATMGECAAILLEAGARSVDILVAARTEWSANEEFMPQGVQDRHFTHIGQE